MIVGAHSIIYSADPEADRAFFQKNFQFPHVDVGGGWLIFRLPPSELAFHPAQVSGKHEFYLMCDNDIHDEPWGRLVDITLPGGALVCVYQAKHESP